NDKCCTNNSKSIDSIHNISNNANNNFSEKDDIVSTSFLNYSFKVTGMDCSACAITIEKALSPLDDISNTKVNFSTSKLTVDLKSHNNINQVAHTLNKLGYGIEENDSNQNYTTFLIEGMDCGSCAKSIEKHLNTLSYVNDAQVSFSTGKMQVDFEGNQTKNIENEVSKIGYSAISQSSNKNNNTKWHLFSKPIISILFLALGIGSSTISLPIWVTNLMYIITIIISGIRPLKSAYYAIKSKSLDMNVLMSVAVIGAVLIGEFFEGAIVVLLFTIGTLLQTISIDKTRNSIQSLMDLTPAEAHIVTETGIISKNLKDIRVGEVLLVKPGDRIPLDGTIIEGSSSLNQAPITGESIPVDKTVIEAPGLYPFLTGYENMKLIDEDPDNKNINLIIEKLKMEDFIHNKAKTYSLGMKQKLGIALAFLNHPQLVVLDEPMNGLDPRAVKDVREAIINLREQGVTFLISSHILSELVKVTDSLLIIDKGEIVRETTMDELNQTDENDLENVLLNIIDRKEKA